MSTQPKTFITPEQYLEMERNAEIKSEYYNGEMFAMSGGSRRHSGIIVNLTILLGTRVRAGCNVFSSDMRVRIPATGLYTYPDLTVTCGSAFEDAGTDTLLNPALIVEVLSPSTERYDRTTKFEHYRRIESLRQYLLVWQDRPHVELYSRQDDGSWRLDEINSLEGTLNLSVLESPLGTSEIYRGIEFPETAAPLPH